MKKYRSVCSGCGCDSSESELFCMLKGDEKGNIMCEDCLNEYKDSYFEDWFEEI